MACRWKGDKPVAAIITAQFTDTYEKHTNVAYYGLSKTFQVSVISDGIHLNLY